jgi:hypothetical protein
MGIIRLEKKYGKDRLENASLRALEVGAVSYRFVSEFLKNNMDFTTRRTDDAPMGISVDPVTKEEQLPLLGEENIRGSGYYH